MACRMVLLGVPGSGKGTQGRRLRERYGVPQIATGEMLREAARKLSPLGIKAKKRMDQGILVPDEVVIRTKSETSGAEPEESAPQTIVRPRILKKRLSRMEASAAGVTAK